MKKKVSCELTQEVGEREEKKNSEALEHLTPSPKLNKIIEEELDPSGVGVNELSRLLERLN
ncbi:MAG: hypothetical protein ABSB00_02290 [Minisyncoccia bacterium]|jgi:hypothetical protein